MADWPSIPAGYGYPLTDTTTKRLPEPTMDAIAADIADKVGDAGTTVGAALSATFVRAVAAQGVADGTANDRAAIVAADSSAVAAGLPVMLPPGTYRVSGSVTINAPIIAQPGAIIKPDNGTVVTLANGIQAGEHRVIDMSTNGVVVPQSVPYFLPAWWGPTGTDDDSATWAKMLVSASYLPTRQRIIVPAGTTRLWQTTLQNVHLQGYGRSSKILPKVGATPGDPKASDTGYVVKLAGQATVDGVDFETDGIAGITVVFWTGSRVWMANGRVRVTGLNTVGVWAYVSGGSLTPKMHNMWVEGNSAGDSGVGIRYESADGEMTNVTVAYCSNGIELLRGSTTLTSVHVWECKNIGVKGVGAGNTRFTACYIEKNAGWGADFDGSSCVIVDAGTRFWDNGKGIASTGGMILRGVGGSRGEDNRIDGQFDDNTGTGLYLESVDRTLGSPLIVSSLVRASSAPVCTDGVYIDAASFGTELSVRSPENSVLGKEVTSPVTGKIVNNQNALQSMINYGAPRKTRKTTATTLGPTTALVSLGYLPIGKAHVYEVEAVLIVDGPQPNDLRVQVRCGSTGMAGWFSVSAAPPTGTASATAADFLPANVESVQASGSTGIVVGTIGAGVRQAVIVRGYIEAGTTASTVEVLASLNTNDGNTVNVSYFDLTLRRVG